MRAARITLGWLWIVMERDLRGSAAFSCCFERPEQAAERQAAATMEGLSFRNLYSVAAMVVRVSACLLTDWRLKLLSKLRPLMKCSRKLWLVTALSSQLRTLRTVSSQSLISSTKIELSV